MELCVSLFGKKEKVLGWLELFEQERLPFKYKGETLREFSPVNILVGFEIPTKIKNFDDDEKVFILESSHIFKKEKKSRVDKTPKLLIEQRKNLLIISKNISSLLIKNRHDRSKISNILRDVLLKAFKLIKLPYVHIWYYPQPCKTIFLFRQDVDFVDEKGVENLIDVTSKFNIKGTYFVNVSGEEEFDEKIGHLKLLKPTTPDRKGVLFKLINQNNEIANHGYWHWVFKDFKNNFQNIKECIWHLYKLLHIKTKGFASPGGEWNKSLAKAIEQNKLLYSSNGLSDGGLPYYPYVNEQKTKTLEIPFYFFCDASFEQTNFQESHSILRDYYLILIQKNMDNGEPIAILGHPHLIGKYAKSFYLPMFQEIKKLGIPNFTIEEFARWWEKRDKLKIFCQKSDNKLIIESNKPNILFEVIYERNRAILKTSKENKTVFYL